MSHPAVAAYRQLVAKVDRFCHQVETAFAGEIACRAGCDSCCRHLSLFPVEAAALIETVRALPEAERRSLTALAEQADSAPCPLLAGGLCRLYAARPLICRTHGLPLLVETETGKQLDACPRNFTGLASLPGSAVLDLEALNAPLAAINRLFLADPPPGWPVELERLSLAGTLLLAGSV